MRLRPRHLLICLGLACSDPGVETTSTNTTTGAETTTKGSGGSSTTFDVEPPEPHLWTVSAEYGEDVGAIFSIWADGPGSIIAVGGQPLQGVALEYVDEAWVRVMDLPEPVPRLSWIHGIGEMRVAVGYYGVVIQREDGLWQHRESGVEAPLWGVWGATEDDLWAVGGGGPEGSPILLHDDGDGWSEVDVSGLVGESNALYKVWGRSADDVYAVGAGGLILHFDGAAWSVQESPIGSTLIGIAGDDDEVVVAGGRSSGVVLRQIDGEWNRLGFPDDEGFDGAWIDGEGYPTVVGRRGFIGRFAPEGIAWTREESGVTDELHTIIGVPGGPVFAVGGHFDSAPYTGVILRRLP